MLLNVLLSTVLIGVSALVPGRCEAEDVNGSGFGINGSASRVAILQPLHDYECVDNVVCGFKIDDHFYQVIDLHCDRKIDYVLRDDGLVLLVLPPLELDGLPSRSWNWAWDGFEPHGSIAWEAVIDDGRPSPFNGVDTHRWLHERGLLGLQDGDVLDQTVHVDEYSIDAWLADVTITTSSRLLLPEIDASDLDCQWFSRKDVDSGFECWSIRIRGDLTTVTRWLVEAGFTELRLPIGGMDYVCRLVSDRNIVQVHLGPNLVATVSLD